MADVVTNAPPLPASNGGEGRHQSAPHEAAQTPRGNRRKQNKQQTHITSKADGTVSDSVTNPIVSPKPKRQTKQRQSVATGAQAPAPAQQAVMGRANGAKPRPVSLGGPLLPATPAKEQAYAGPTFHASPAPSSLPVPRFFSKSVPNVIAPLQAQMEGEKTPEKQSSPESDTVSPVAPREAQRSPLDMFFQAHKEEKQRTYSDGNLLSPEMATRRPVPATEPRNPFQQSGKSIFLHELDGNNEDMPSPRTVPVSSRPALVERSHSSPSVRPLAASEDERAAQTKSLKDLLFNVNNAPAQAQTPASQQRAQSDAQSFKTPSPSNRPASTSGPTTPATDQPNHYALHYGNRNLSPMFKAARNETPSRPSSLRQELPNGDRASAPSNGAPSPRQMPPIDPNSFARDFLNQQAQNARPVSLPQLPFQTPSNASSSASGQPGVDGGVSLTSDGPPRTVGSRDLSSMENDIKRMLRLNVSG
ncbi:hypothetical protein LTR56_013224 [Elasticomyces elasticus]|nr:hypothetical protein LTR56_013224 [Elasticomyces elasticus]KAK3650081.1 hypothetical protein LTR22_012676 [Elasticomyces elasticus]KAK4920084.1 hypothetical protein LTR49_012345 [Elasticomyces elasticus]KAK5757192.1 hypothetical protein LTS12_012708 [Elasticomyces elasticus]